MAEICDNCKLIHAPAPPLEGRLEDDYLEREAAMLRACFDAQRTAMRQLLDNVGDPGACRGCRVPIYWITHRNGKKTPYTHAGLNHFIDCPERKQFARKGAKP